MKPMEPEGYYEKLFDAKLESIRERLSGMDKALELQAKEMERRMFGLNELREEVTRDRGQFVLKDSCTLCHKEIDSNSSRLSILETRVVIYVGVLGFIFVLVQVALKFFK